MRAGKSLEISGEPDEPETRRREVRMPPVSAAKRHKNVATAEGIYRGKTKPRQGRKTVALEKSFAPAGAWFCPNGNHGLQPWLYSDAAPRPFRLILFSLTKAIRLTRSGGQQRNGPGSDPPHLFFGVRDVDKREAQARVQIENRPAEFILKFIVQIRKRLVHQYCQRLCYESACDGDTLLLAAGQPCGIGIFETIQATASQHFRNAFWRTFASSGCAFRAKSRFS